MLFNNHLIFAILFIAAGVNSGELEISDYNSIQEFITNILGMESKYKLDNHTLSYGEVNNITKTIFNDSLNLLAEVNKIPQNNWPVPSYSENLIYFFNKLDQLRAVRNVYRWSQLSRKLNTILHISEDIRFHVETLHRILGNYFLDNNDLPIIYCSQIVSNCLKVMLFPERKNLFEEYQEFIKSLSEIMHNENYSNFCGEAWSFHLAIYYLYREVIISGLQEFILYHYLDVLNHRCRSHETWHHRGTETSNFMMAIRKTKDLLKDARHYQHSCDRTPYGKVSHYELRQMIQTVIIKEEDLTTDGSCSHNCNLGYIDTINTTQCDEYQDCQYISSSYDICEVKSNSRRFWWFNDTNGIVYGHEDKECDFPIKSVSSELAVFKFCYSDYCVCTCLKKTGDKKAITAISFREQVSDIDNDRFVVGVRFIEKNNMIHVQIKEKHINNIDGFFFPYPWNELENIKYDETSKNFYNSNNTVLKPGIDYGHPKMVNFDDLIAPKGYVITGVRLGFAVDKFKKIDLEAAAIELHIRVTPFDYVTGKLINLAQTHWIVPEYTSRKELILTNPDHPLKSPFNELDSKKGQFIRFRNSDLKKDAGQSTVPFFDALEVKGYPLYPLGGMGIIHLGNKGYGGFLAFKIYDINLANALNDELL